MVKKALTSLKKLTTKLPLVYSIILIFLVPTTLAINTLWNLRTFERDMHFAVREQALIAQKMFTILMKDQELNKQTLQKTMTRLQRDIPEVISMSILEPSEIGNFKILTTTDENSAESDAQLFLNQMTWYQEETFFTQIYEPSLKENLWVLVAPLNAASGEKIALVNLKFSAAKVNSVVARTTRDSLIILGVSVIGIILLLVNHLRFFERSIMFEKLRQLDQMKDDFISVASHELRTPLFAIKGYLAEVENELKSKLSKQAQRDIVLVKQSIQRLDDLVEDLLCVSRIQQSRLDFTPSPINTNEIISEVVNQLLPMVQEKKLELIFEKEMSVPQILGQPDRFREVMINLVGNAIKYTPKGRISVSQIVEDKKIKILVKDTGIGIAPEDQERLFQKFSRIITDQTETIPGTGLGLWITKQLVERMQGQIFVDSIVGEGTVFTVMFKRTEVSKDQSLKTQEG